MKDIDMRLSGKICSFMDFSQFWNRNQLFLFIGLDIWWLQEEISNCLQQIEKVLLFLIVY